jgi:hypothetical protein
MKSSNLKTNLVRAFLVSTAILGTSIAGLGLAQDSINTSSNESRDKLSIAATPINHTKYLVLMANGIFDPNDPNFTPPDFDFFAREIMGWNDQQIAEYRQKAIKFFEKRFGINPESPEYAGRVIMVPFMLDPRWQYRVYTSSGDYVPPRGWVARDGGFQLVVVDPAGVELGGEFKGWQAPQGALAVFGEFNILVKPQLRGQPEEIIIHYESRQPVLQNSRFPLDRSGNGALVAPFDVYHPEWGHGWAFAHIIDVPQPDGKLQVNNRNIMTFPAGAPFPDLTNK